MSRPPSPGSPPAHALPVIRHVDHDRLLEVTTVATTRDRHHPVMVIEPGGSYDRFRGVHDVLGQPAQPKAILLDPRLLRRSVRAALTHVPTRKGAS